MFPIASDRSILKVIRRLCIIGSRHIAVPANNIWSISPFFNVFNNSIGNLFFLDWTDLWCLVPFFCSKIITLRRFQPSSMVCLSFWKSIPKFMRAMIVFYIYSKVLHFMSGTVSNVLTLWICIVLQTSTRASIAMLIKCTRLVSYRILSNSKICCTNQAALRNYCP